jgi:glycosyltransferase
MKISIVTAVFNRAHCISNAIRSIQSQTFNNIEHVVIDGLSTDGTLDILNEMLTSDAVFLSERDNGIYDALNKGFMLATGDVIGILHSDDVFFDNKVIERVAHEFLTKPVDYVYGDIIMIHDDETISRHWQPGVLHDGRIFNKQIPHPALFIKRKLFEQISPPFDASYSISADLKQQLILANILNAKGAYLPMPLVKMKTGGASTFNYRSYLQGWAESRRAWNEVHGRGGALFVFRKVLSKFSGIRI